MFSRSPHKPGGGTNPVHRAYCPPPTYHEHTKDMTSKQTRITATLLDKVTRMAQHQGRRGARDIIEQAVAEHIARMTAQDPTLAVVLEPSTNA